MCGRYRRQSDKQRIAETFAVGAGLEDLYLEPEDEIAPGSLQPVIRINASGEREIERMRWGFKKEDGKLLFNARAESIESGKFWKKSFAERRCIVPADSFYEWQKVNSGKKPKFECKVRNGQLFGMAGLWSLWKDPKTEKWEDAFAIVTVSANEVMAPIHDRQPAILEPRDYRQYLEQTERAPAHMLRILSSGDMRVNALGERPASASQPSLFEGG